MKSDTLAPVLAAMNPDAAQRLTVKLASKLVLTDTAGGHGPHARRHASVLLPAAKPPEKTSAAPAPGPAPKLAAKPGASGREFEPGNRRVSTPLPDPKN